MKKQLLLLTALASASCIPMQAGNVTLPAGKYPVPVERRVPWTIISGTDCSDVNKEGANNGGIDKLIDRNPLTYWHSDYNGCDANDPSHSHWFMIDRGIGASNVPFDMMSLQQRVTGQDQGWNGAVTEADIYVTDEYIGLIGGVDNKQQDDALITSFLRRNPVPTTTIHPNVTTQEAQLFDFDSETPQTGRFILFVVKHAENPDMSESQYPDEKYACLAEFNLFAPDTFVEAENFAGDYAITGENPANAVKASTRTVSLTFSDSFTNEVRFSPMLQSNEDPYIPDLNWLDWERTYFDITPLMTISVADNHEIQINATGEGSNMYKALYVDFDETGGFTDSDLVKALPEAGTVAGLFEANLDITVDDYSKIYRARYIVDSEAISSPTPREGIGEAGGIVVDFLIKIEQPVTFSINYFMDGVNVKTVENVTGFANVPFTRETPDFFDADVVAVAPDPDNFSEGETPSIDITLRRLTLPFAYTTADVTTQEEFDNLKWQPINCSFNVLADKRTWTYNEDNESVSWVNQPEFVKKDGYKSYQLWAFVGNIFDGFKIYNKQAGRDKWLYKDGTVKIGAGADNLWMPYVVRSGAKKDTDPAANRPSNKYCLLSSTKGDATFINPRTDGSLNFFGDWDDKGSTCWFPQIADPLIEYAETLINDAGIVGMPYGGNTKDLCDALDIATIDNTNPETAANLSTEINKYIDAAGILEFDSAKWYRLINKQHGGYLATDPTDYSIKGNKTDPTTNYHSIVKFEEVAENTYHIISQGFYFGQAIHNGGVWDVAVNQVEETGVKGEYVMAPVEGSNSLFTFTDVSSTTGADPKRSLHESGGHNVVVWNNGSTTYASHWYVKLAEDIEMNLPETKIPGLGNAGFGFFPFPVSSADSGTKLYTIEPGTDKDSGADVVTYMEVASVPAETAFIAANEELTTVTLQIGAPSAPKQVAAYYDAADTEAPAKFADGTFRAKDAAAGDYVLDNTGDVLSFKKTTDAANVAGNYVYLPAANVESTAEELPFNAPSETTTEITEVNVGSPAAKAVYDLQGRKLAAPAKGINIINGKKILVK